MYGLEERTEQRVVDRASLEDEWPRSAAPLIRAREAGLHALEIRKAVGVVPRLHPRVGRPTLIVQRVAALEDHAVDAARTTENLAAAVSDAAIVHEGLWL